MAVKNFFVFFMVNTPLKLCYMKGFVWVENDCRLLSCRRHRLRSRNVFFIAVLPLWFDFLKSSEKIKKSVPNNRDRQICDTTRVDVHYPNIRSFLIHHHVCTLVNAVCSASAIPEMYKHFFPAALKSPFTIASCTAFPPTAALYARRIRLLTLSQRFVLMLALL